MYCLEITLEGNYDFVFLYDHSSGRTKKRGGELDVTDINKDWGGGVIRTTLIKDKSYLVPYHGP